jgi:ribulose-phosphate 3-epimerase
MIEVIPAVMPDGLDDMRGTVDRVRGHVETVQLDIMDGQFVPEKTWPYTDNGFEELSQLKSEEEGFPYWQEVNYEVDLMIANPELYISNWIAAGVQRIIVHVESTNDIEAIQREVAAQSAGDELLGVGVELGIALNPDTDNSVLEQYMKDVQFVQFMGIDRIGYQEQEFNEDVLVKIRDLRKQYPDAIISVDGGVNVDTAPKLVEAGVNRLVSGSTVFGSDDIAGVIQHLQNLDAESA